MWFFAKYRDNLTSYTLPAAPIPPGSGVRIAVVLVDAR